MSSIAIDKQVKAKGIVDLSIGHDDDDEAAEYRVQLIVYPEGNYVIEIDLEDLLKQAKRLCPHLF